MADANPRPRATRAIVSVPATVRAGELIEVRAMIAHPMETGHRADGAGGVVPRDIIRRVQCWLDTELVLVADWHAAVAANPLLSFDLVARPGTLRIRWEGDGGFVHEEALALRMA